MARRTYTTLPRQIVTGTADGLPSGSVIVGPILRTEPALAGSISASISVRALTASLTFTPSWQVANKDDFSDAQVIEIGEIGAVHAAEANGVAVVRAIPAPEAVSGFMFARLVLTTAGATGATQDTYLIQNCWAEPTIFDLVHAQ